MTALQPYYDSTGKRFFEVLDRLCLGEGRQDPDIKRLYAILYNEVLTHPYYVAALESEKRAGDTVAEKTFHDLDEATQLAETHLLSQKTGLLEKSTRV